MSKRLTVVTCLFKRATLKRQPTTAARLLQLGVAGYVAGTREADCSREIRQEFVEFAITPHISQ